MFVFIIRSPNITFWGNLPCICCEESHLACIPAYEGICIVIIEAFFRKTKRHQPKICVTWYKGYLVVHIIRWESWLGHIPKVHNMQQDTIITLYGHQTLQASVSHLEPTILMSKFIRYHFFLARATFEVYVFLARVGFINPFHRSRK